MFDFDAALAAVPMLQRYRDYARQRQMTLGDLLLENRIVFLAGVINDMSAVEVVMKLLYLQYDNKSQEIPERHLPLAGIFAIALELGFEGNPGVQVKHVESLHSIYQDWRAEASAPCFTRRR